RMPLTKALPHQWFDTPNIHLCSLADFERTCKALGINMLQRATVDHAHRSGFGMRLFPQLLGEIALYRIQRGRPAVQSGVRPRLKAKRPPSSVLPLASSSFETESRIRGHTRPDRVGPLIKPVYC
ncbi:MAG: methionine biosynthesis protein MetW, partial [Gammaproteobacteria bacterium]